MRHLWREDDIGGLVGRQLDAASAGRRQPAGAVWLASRVHVDSFSDLPEELQVDFGRVAARVERAILALGDVARVHLYRWGDGGAHFHVWFLPRPLGMLEASGMMLPLWEDALPNLPDEELAAAAGRVAAADVSGTRVALVSRRDARGGPGDRRRASPCRVLRLRDGPQQPGSGPSELDRPETIEETADLIGPLAGRVGARGRPRGSRAVAELVAKVEREQGRLDVLVNDIFGGDQYMEWDKPQWEHDWAGGLRMLQMGVHTHLITCRAAIPLMLKTAARREPMVSSSR